MWCNRAQVLRRNRTIDVTGEDQQRLCPRSVFPLRLLHAVTTVLGAFTLNQCLGAATILIGLTREHALKMLKLVSANSVRFTAKVDITCTIDIAPSIAFRKAKFARVTTGTPLISDRGISCPQ